MFGHGPPTLTEWAFLVLFQGVGLLLGWLLDSAARALFRRVDRKTPDGEGRSTPTAPT
jgi:hypothetical protein